MERNKELIERYKQRINKMELELKNQKCNERIFYLEGKISVYKMVIIDLSY